MWERIRAYCPFSFVLFAVLIRVSKICFCSCLEVSKLATISLTFDGSIINNSTILIYVFFRLMFSVKLVS